MHVEDKIRSNKNQAKSIHCTWPNNGQGKKIADNLLYHSPVGYHYINTPLEVDYISNYRHTKSTSKAKATIITTLWRHTEAGASWGPQAQSIIVAAL